MQNANSERKFPKGEARIRVQLSAAHTREQLDRALSVFEEVGKELGAI